MRERTCPSCGTDLTGAHGKRKWCSESCRRDTLYGGNCERCGRRQTHSAGWTSSLCRPCRIEVEHERARTYYIEAVQDWHRRYGEVPSAADWNDAPSQLAQRHPDRRAVIEARHQDRDWPHISGALRVFGSWAALIEAAGFVPLRPGQRRDPKTWQAHRWPVETAPEAP